MAAEPEVLESLKSELATAEAELRVHMASWEYAFAMGSSADGGRQHPKHRETRERTERLVIRCRDLRARVAEHEV
jgi:hypothetical protein